MIDYYRDLRKKIRNFIAISLQKRDTWLTVGGCQTVYLGFLDQGLPKTDLVLSVALQSLSIKETQNSTDFTAVTISTPLPEQNLAKFTQQQSIIWFHSYRL